VVPPVHLHKCILECLLPPPETLLGFLLLERCRLLLNNIQLVVAVLIQQQICLDTQLSQQLRRPIVQPQLRLTFPFCN
jgi:hypothetical protein